MSNIHDQAMYYIYQQVLERLMEHMTQAQRASVQLLIQRLLVSAGGVEYLHDFRLLVVLGHDRSTLSLLAFLRAAQLSIALRAPDTFRLQVVVGSRTALTDDLLDTFEQACTTLFLQDDPRVELLAASGSRVQSFSRQALCGVEPLDADRDMLLMFGHLAAGQPEAVLGSRLHLEAADTLRALLICGAAPSALVTAIPARQRQRYVAWSRATMRLSGERGDPAVHRCAGALCEMLGRVHGLLASALHDPGNAVSGPRAELALRVIAVDDLLNHPQADDRLISALGLRRSPSASAALAATCIDPAYLNHLQGLYVHWSQPGSDTAWMSNESSSGLFKRAYGIDEVQLTCLLFAPFAERGEGLANFIERCHPAMRGALPHLHQALQGEPCPQSVVQWMLDTSGLSLAQLRALYEGRIDPIVSRLVRRLARRDTHLRLIGPSRPHPSAATAGS
ncbi:hypothetical protein IAE35_06195 [Pseudomonas sp. S75]|uniref:hypothetical protein n=1 Tax=unclassified Pseudomonas TaxID=196821 RepID=UPI0019034275|nr:MULTISPECIES: hypothetical protein [unclassified Pseudomonas]MBJ9975087.1 hypothetical protein [Pseudomonas sp. S30]MBK0152924.1 hypothetical protein [Pseudomonas sp. S75]